MRRPKHELQKARRLHETATSQFSRHPVQTTRRNPCAKIPHLRNASPSSVTKRGSSGPDFPGAHLGEERSPVRLQRVERTVFSGRWRS